MWKTVEVECWNYRKSVMSKRTIISLDKRGCQANCDVTECPMNTKRKKAIL